MGKKKAGTQKSKPKAPAEPPEPKEFALSDGEVAMLERNETLQELIERTIQVSCAAHFARRDLWNKQLGDRIKERLGLDSLEGYEIDVERGVLRPHSG